MAEQKRGQSLIASNPHLSDGAKRRRMVVDFVYGSNKLEGIKVTRRQTQSRYETETSNPLPKKVSKIVKDL